jgi:hypothetical protein
VRRLHTAARQLVPDLVVAEALVKFRCHLLISSSGRVVRLDGIDDNAALDANRKRLRFFLERLKLGRREKEGAR